MARDWEATFSAWASSPGKAEQDRMDNAVAAVRKALDADTKLEWVTKVFLQGSYRNRVNVRKESDVDLGVLYTGDSFGVEYLNGVDDAAAGNKTGSYTPAQFKDDVGRALKAYFGSAVTRGDKAFDIHENSYRVDADVVPLFVHRRYSSSSHYICGVQLHPDSGGRIINWPERLYDDPHWPNQHYENGNTKNSATKRRYRGLVRILKSLRNEMDDVGVAVAKPLCGFFVECLTWNVPSERLFGPTWDADVQRALAFLWTNTKEMSFCSEWGEVSELKYLFNGSDSKRQEAHDFINLAWDYVGIR